MPAQTLPIQDGTRIYTAVDPKGGTLREPSAEKPKKIIPDPELPPAKCQHVKILDVDKPVQRVFYECYHCLHGLVSECSGLPAIEEFRGREQIQEIKVKCPNCEKTAISLLTGKVISTTEIPSPWAVE